MGEKIIYEQEVFNKKIKEWYEGVDSKILYSVDSHESARFYIVLITWENFQGEIEGELNFVRVFAMPDPMNGGELKVNISVDEATKLDTKATKYIKKDKIKEEILGEKIALTKEITRILFNQFKLMS